MPMLQRSKLKGREIKFCVLAHIAVKQQSWNLNTQLAQVCAFNRFAVILSTPRVRPFAGRNTLAPHNKNHHFTDEETEAQSQASSLPEDTARKGQSFLNG